MKRYRFASVLLLTSYLLSLSRAEKILKRDNGAGSTNQTQQVSRLTKIGRISAAPVLGASRNPNLHKGPGQFCDDVNDFCRSDACLSDKTCDCSIHGHWCDSQLDCCSGFDCVSSKCVQSPNCSNATCYNNDNFECCGDSRCIEATCVACRKENESCNEDDECCGTTVCESNTCKPDKNIKEEELAPVNKPASVLSDSNATTNGTESKPSCFPSEAVVTLHDGTQKRMVEIEIGDKVLTTNSKFSPVFMFTHRLASVSSVFLELQTEQGPKIRLTNGHYLAVNGGMRRAGAVKIGDFLHLADGSRSLVSSISKKQMMGLFNPQTVDGNIVVDGILASTYTEAVEIKTAHSLLSPLRALYILLGLSFDYLHSGLDALS